MIAFDRFELDNGLRVIVHKDTATQLVAINLLYDVGARDEDPSRTGFAHLFEHLMFGGSKNIPQYDRPLQIVGGDNNAFTTNDITNYYITLPKSNIETGFWLESDRMLELAFSEKSLEVQRNVVVEEFKQRYLNQPYGDIWMEMRNMAYKVHPYRWPTIGQEIAHIEDATMPEVKDFFYRHYRPNNAVLVVAGDVETAEVKRLAEKWFGPIPRGENRTRSLPQEVPQTEARTREVKRNVPHNALYKAWHMSGRTDAAYYPIDLVTDVLSRGRSGRLYRELVKQQQLMTDVSAYVTGSFDPGLLVVSGKLADNVTMEQAEAAIESELQKMREELVAPRELEKVLNKIESSLVFSEMSALDKAMNLAIAELLGNADDVNREVDKYRSVTRNDIRDMAGNVLTQSNSSTLYYYAEPA